MGCSITPTTFFVLHLHLYLHFNLGFSFLFVLAVALRCFDFGLACAISDSTQHPAWQIVSGVLGGDWEGKPFPILSSFLPFCLVTIPCVSFNFRFCT